MITPAIRATRPRFIAPAPRVRVPAKSPSVGTELTCAIRGGFADWRCTSPDTVRASAHQRSAHPGYRLDENALRGHEVQPDVPGAAGPEDMPGTECDTCVVEEPAGRPGQIGHHRKIVGGLLGDTELRAVQPRQVSTLRPLVFLPG